MDETTVAVSQHVMLGMADYIIVGIILLSILVSLLRGFVKEFFSLVAWGVAIWAALTFMAPVSELFATKITAPTLRLVISFGLIFIGTLVLGAMVNFLLAGLVEKSGLSGTDRVLGAVFGMVRGVLIVAILIVVVDFTPLTQDARWQSAVLVPYFQGLTDWLMQLLPQAYSLLKGE